MLGIVLGEREGMTWMFRNYTPLLLLLTALCSTGGAWRSGDQNTPPVFDMKREWIVPEDEPLGGRVTTVRTRDDEGDPIEYGIEPAVFLDGSSYFSVDRKSGRVIVDRPLTGLAGNDYYLFITANDGHQTAKIEVYVRIVKAASDGARVGDSGGSHPHLPFHISAPIPQPAGDNEGWTTETPPPAATTRPKEAALGLNMNWVLPLVATIAFTPVLGVIVWLVNRNCRVHEKIKAEKKVSEDSSALYLPHASLSKCEFGESTEGVKFLEGCREFPRHQLRFVCLLGEGCFGQVWKCETQDATVAVKTLKENASEKEKSDLVKELEVMKLLEPHPNVVSLLGCCTDKDPMFLILEYVSRGKLQTFLRESRAELSYGTYLYGSGRELTSRHLTAFAYQVARGMQYLSSKGIIHRDLAARNVLVSDTKTCKVADFGFARDTQLYERKSEGRLPIRWMAPESLHDNVFTTKTDVWAFGVLMWEIVTLGSTPYPGLSASEVVRRVRCEESFRLEKPAHCGREVYNIMFYCWHKDPEKRPCFSEIVRLLDVLLASENDYIELDRFPDHAYYNITTASTHTDERL